MWFAGRGGLVGVPGRGVLGGVSGSAFDQQSINKKGLKMGGLVGGGTVLSQALFLTYFISVFLKHSRSLSALLFVFLSLYGTPGR